jgi:hypothetical protein
MRTRKTSIQIIASLLCNAGVDKTLRNSMDNRVYQPRKDKIVAPCPWFKGGIKRIRHGARTFQETKFILHNDGFHHGP